MIPELLVRQSDYFVVVPGYGCTVTKVQPGSYVEIPDGTILRADPVYITQPSDVIVSHTVNLYKSYSPAFFKKHFSLGVSYEKRIGSFEYEGDTLPLEVEAQLKRIDERM